MGEQGEEDSQRELKHLRNRGDAIFRECHAQILFDGVDEHLMGAKHWPSTLQHRQQQLQGDNLGPQLMGPAEERNCLGVSCNASSLNINKSSRTLKMYNSMLFRNSCVLMSYF